ncbi:MAG TPA: hypothetical protein VFL63_05235 [Rhodanobacteraceae bacterium]|nr:hypothetical protein [Rhodanobacteraceae bacterium]
MNAHPILFRSLLIALIATSAAPTALAASGQHLVTDDGACQLTVPANWKPLHIMGKLLKFHANSPDGSAGASISSDAPFSLAQVKQIAESSAKVTKVFEDTTRRLWIQITMSGATGTHWYVAVPGCHADIHFARPSQGATAKQIASSMQSVH